MEYTNDIGGWMSIEELDILLGWARASTSVVEVGCWKGRSTHALLTGCKGPVFAVDHFMGSPNEREVEHKEAVTGDIYKQFYENVGHFPNLVVMRMDSVQAARYFQYKSIDMVFIDATHTREAVIKDILSWMPVCRARLCGHDRGSPGVDEALEELQLNVKMQSNNYSLWYVDLCGGYNEIYDRHGHDPDRNNGCVPEDVQ